MKYFYFVSYTLDNGFGSAEFERQSPIISKNDLVSIQSGLCESEGYTKVLILNYQLLRVEEDAGCRCSQVWLHQFLAPTSRERIKATAQSVADLINKPGPHHHPKCPRYAATAQEVTHG